MARADQPLIRQSARELSAKENRQRRNQADLNESLRFLIPIILKLKQVLNNDFYKYTKQQFCVVIKNSCISAADIIT